jgi:flagellar basal body-associated protein FliL
MPEHDAETQQPEGKRKLPMRVMLVVASIMVLEGAGVFLFLFLTSGPPEGAMANVEGADQADREASVEILLVQDRYQNMSTNRLWRWDAVIYIKVRKKNEKFVKDTMDARAAEIQAGVTQIFRRAQHSQLKEPDLKTLTRQFTAFVNQIFGDDPDGMPRVDKVLITSLNGLPTDG